MKDLQGVCKFPLNGVYNSAVRDRGYEGNRGIWGVRWCCGLRG